MTELITQHRSLAPQTGDRAVFFDNLRFMFIIGVVLQHAGMAYCGVSWWPVCDGFYLPVGAIVAFFDGFLMPSLFGIAGYFAIVSIRRKTSVQFIKGKLRRLGIPWLVCTLFIGPVLPLVYHYTRNAMTLSASYWQTWQAVMKNAAAFNTGLLPPMTQVMQYNLFYQRYMWFISVLIAFFLVLSIVHKLGKKWFISSLPPYKAVARPILSPLMMFVSIGSITFLGSTAIIGIMFALAPDTGNPETWFTLGNVVQFRVSRIFLHAAYFVIGILAYKHKWIERGKFPGRLGFWFAAFIVSCTAYFSAYTFMLNAQTPDTKKMLGLLLWFCLNFFAISAFGFSLSAAIRFLNKRSSLSKTASGQSYNLYLSHYLFVIGFQLCFACLPNVPVLLKFGLVAFLSICCGLLVSRYLIKPFPKITIALVFCLFLFMVLVIRS